MFPSTRRHGSAYQELGMAFKTAVDNLDEIDEVLREHYVEVTKDGKKSFVIGLDGDVKVLPQFKTLQTENGAFRIKARDFEEKYGKLKAFEGMDPSEVLAKIDRIVELEATNGGQLDEKKIDSIVEGRVRVKVTPLERQIAALTTERDGFKNQYEDLSRKDKQRLIGDEVRNAATKLKMLPEAVEDAIMLAERNMEVTDEGVATKTGDTPENWLKDMQAKRPHWWGPSAGGGARGGAGGNAGAGGRNPWSAEHWNMTEQNKVYLADPKRAATLAERAGTKVGGMKPKPAK
jgi:hypothetical protein